MIGRLYQRSHLVLGFWGEVLIINSNTLVIISLCRFFVSVLARFEGFYLSRNLSVSFSSSNLLTKKKLQYSLIIFFIPKRPSNNVSPFLLEFEVYSYLCLGCYNKIPQRGKAINNRNLFLRVLEAEKSMIKVTTWLHSGQSSSWFITHTFLLGPHVVEWDRELCRTSFIRLLIPFIRALPVMT